MTAPASRETPWIAATSMLGRFASELWKAGNKSCSAWLRPRLLEKGKTANPDHVGLQERRSLNKDPDLDPLRGRRVFKKLLPVLEKK